MSNKLQAKDLINLGLFTVLYFVIGCCVAIPIGFVPIFLPILGALWSLITGIPFMLFLTRVKKFGMVTIMGILSGLLMGLTGMGFWGVPMGVIFGLLCRQLAVQVHLQHVQAVHRLPAQTLPFQFSLQSDPR